LKISAVVFGVVTAVALAALAAIPASANSTPPLAPKHGTTQALDADQPGYDAKVMATQDLLDTVAEPISELVDPSNGTAQIASSGVSAGYAGLIIDPHHGSMNLYWVGALPAEVESIVSNAPSGITVNVIAARYALWQEEAAAISLEKNTDATIAGASIADVKPSNKGDGLIVDVVSLDNAKSADVSSAAAKYSLGIPVSVGDVLGNRMPAPAKWTEASALAGVSAETYATNSDEIGS
jgi:hypothetical protein